MLSGLLTTCTAASALAFLSLAASGFLPLSLLPVLFAGAGDPVGEGLGFGDETAPAGEGEGVAVGAALLFGGGVAVPAGLAGGSLSELPHPVNSVREDANKSAVIDIFFIA